MTMNLSPIAGFGSLWTSQSKYIIDFERGLVTHSKTLTKGQFNRWMSQPTKVQRPEFNPRQAFKYYTNYLIGEKFLLFIKKSYHNELSKLFFQASPSYAQNHRDVFERVDNQLVYPIVQVPYGGFVRTKLERENIVKYVEKIIEKANLYGMNFWNSKESDGVEARTYDALRDIAFRSRQTPAAAAAQVADQ